MKSIQTICFIVFTAFFVNGQTMTDARGKEQPERRIVLREGWTTPVFADLVKKIVDLKAVKIDNIEIQRRHHSFAKRIVVFAESCYPDNDKKLVQEGRQWHFEVGGFVSYQIKGKVFAYVTRNGLINTGAFTQFVYVDEDGNGNFQLRCQTTQQNELPDVKNLPDWVKTLAAK